MTNEYMVTARVYFDNYPSIKVSRFYLAKSIDLAYTKLQKHIAKNMPFNVEIENLIGSEV